MDSKQIQKLIKRRHPRYEEMKSHWDFLESCYVGGRAWFTTENIFRYLKEGAGEYKDRLQRAYRFNHSREVVDLVNKYLFRAEIHRKAEPSSGKLESFWTKATLCGMDINEFMQGASIKGSTFGRSWVVVDSDIPVMENATEKDLEGYQGPYVYLVRPQDAMDMSWGDDGKLNWIVIREFIRDDKDPLSSTGKVTEAYRLWTRNDWTLVGKKIPGKVNGVDVLNSTNGAESTAGTTFEVIDSGVHNLGEVPVLRNDNGFGGDLYTSPALIADIAYLDRACANYASNLDAIIQDQTFSQLAMPAQGVLPGDDAYAKLLEMGTKRVFLYDGEAGAAPAYLSPDPRQAQLIISAIGQLINEIYHSVGLAGERTKQDNSKGIDNSSGVAKSRDFERVLALLKAKATCLETVENNISRLVCLWNGDKYETDLVTYSEDFDVRSLADEIEVTLAVTTLDAPESALAEQMKIMIRKLLPNSGKAAIDLMDKEADEWARLQKERSESEHNPDSNTGRLLEEARRNRTAAGEKQSDTKQQETAA